MSGRGTDPVSAREAHPQATTAGLAGGLGQGQEPNEENFPPSSMAMKSIFDISVKMYINTI
jgi:hypothetical protein